MTQLVDDRNLPALYVISKEINSIYGQGTKINIILLQSCSNNENGSLSETFDVIISSFVFKLGSLATYARNICSNSIQSSKIVHTLEVQY